MGIFDQVSEYLPEVSFTGIFSFITNLIIFLIVTGGAIALIYYLLMKSRYNNKIVIFEEINGRTEVTGHDTARLVKVGHSGDVVFLLRKRKKYLPTPRIQTGRKTYWFGIMEDGEWINIAPKSLNKEANEVGIKMINQGVALARLGLQKNLRERYDKKSFLEKYGAVIAYVSLILVTGIAIWLVADKFLSIVDKVAEQVALANKLAITQEQILGALDNVCSTSGLKPVG